MEGARECSFEDVESVAFPSMRHRIITNFEAMADGKTNDQIIQEIIENIERFLKQMDQREIFDSGFLKAFIAWNS